MRYIYVYAYRKRMPNCYILIYIIEIMQFSLSSQPCFGSYTFCVNTRYVLDKINNRKFA